MMNPPNILLSSFFLLLQREINDVSLPLDVILGMEMGLRFPAVFGFGSARVWLYTNLNIFKVNLIII